jgi:hypothetical protein
LGRANLFHTVCQWSLCDLHHGSALGETVRVGAILDATTREEFAYWLAEHQDKAEMWLLFYRQAMQRPKLSYDDAVEEALRVDRQPGQEARRAELCAALHSTPSRSQMVGLQPGTCEEVHPPRQYDSSRLGDTASGPGGGTRRQSEVGAG